jgi:enoyl-CoA hydratase/carnithine racemase
VVLAEEALALGLINYVLPVDEVFPAALAYAGDIAANCSPSSMAAMKRQVYADLERGLTDATARADQLMLESFAKPDFQEGVSSFLERGEPRFAVLAG